MHGGLPTNLFVRRRLLPLFVGRKAELSIHACGGKARENPISRSACIFVCEEGGLSSSAFYSLEDVGTGQLSSHQNLWWEVKYLQGV